MHHGSNKDIAGKMSLMLSIMNSCIMPVGFFDVYYYDKRGKCIWLISMLRTRVLFERRYMSMVEKNNISSQQLLEHILIELYENSQLIEQYMDELRKMGFDLDFFGERVIALRGVPVMFNKNQSQQFIYEVLELLQNDKQIQKS